MMQVFASFRHGRRDIQASIVAALVATIYVWTVVYAEPAGDVFPVLLADRSCRDLASDQSSQTTDCDPDAPGWAHASDDTQVQQVIVAENVDSPGSVAAAAQNQDAPITQLP